MVTCEDPLSAYLSASRVVSAAAVSPFFLRGLESLLPSGRPRLLWVGATAADASMEVGAEVTAAGALVKVTVGVPAAGAPKEVILKVGAEVAAAAGGAEDDGYVVWGRSGFGLGAPEWDEYAKKFCG